MTNKILTLFLMFMIWDCQPSKNKITKDTFSTFIDSLNTTNPKSCSPFREHTVKWWNTTHDLKTHGQPQIINDTISLNQIKEFNKLQVDSIFITEDTIKGLYSIKNIGLLSNGKTCLGINKYNLVLGNTGKITSIICIPWDLTSKACLNVQDEDLTGNDYHIFMKNILYYEDIYEQNKFELLK